MLRIATVLFLATLLISGCESVTAFDCPNKDLSIMSAMTDTTLMIGRTGQMRATIQNECGEEVRPTFHSTSKAISVSEGGHVNALKLGRAEIQVRVDGVVATSINLSVVPVARLSIAMLQPQGFVTMNADGSDMRDIQGLILNAPATDWSRDRTRVAVSGHNAGSPTIFFGSPEGPLRSMASDLESINLQGPAFSPDGSLVYAYDAFRGAIYRVHVASQQIDTLLSSRFEEYRSTTLSRDGRRLAFLRIPRVDTDLIRRVTILDLETNQETSFPTEAVAIRWSPVSDSLAVVEDGAVKMVSADWSVKRTFSDPQRLYDKRIQGHPVNLSWSPDGKWIISPPPDGGVGDMIEIATGLTLPLHYSRMISMAGPFWLQ